MAKDDVLTRTLRLNLTNDQHLKVAKVIVQMLLLLNLVVL